MLLKLAALFSDHMVLQRGIPVPVWGWAAPGEKVAVEIAGRTANATTEADGKWMTTLPPMEAGGPFELKVNGPGTILLKDVMVGEVWVCSGQSNMEFTLSFAQNAEQEVAAADHPDIRSFTVSRTTQQEPQKDTQGEWSRCTPETAGSFSAVGYYFGREIHRKIGVPVGLINSSWGGTCVETWTSRETLTADPFCKRMVEEYENDLRHPEEALRKAHARRAEWDRQFNIKDTKNEGEAWGWARPETATDDWPDMVLPCHWQNAGHDYSGIFWFQKTVDIPRAWAGRDLQLSLGPTDKSDVTYFNGIQVGSLTLEQCPDAWCTPRHYTIPGRLVKTGRNVIAVRVFSNIYAGGFGGSSKQMRLAPADDEAAPAIGLAGSWRYKIERNFGLIPGPPPEARKAGDFNLPSMLFNNMIMPLLPYAIRGAIWYQGESNVANARQYRILFPMMIRSWREAWRQGDFPFLFVQLANFMTVAKIPGNSQWAELREAQTMALALPNTGMAVTIDIGEAEDIHPPNKKDMGIRLSLPALARIYGFKDLVFSGPLYTSMRVEGKTIRVEFHHVGRGLVARGDKLQGFAVAGEDRKFVWADARIDGNSVVVSSPQVPNPVAVRYAWANNPVCTLFNASDLPASPFRTDDWPGITI